MADLSPPTDALYAAGGYELQCHGSFECTLTLGAITATVNVSVVQGLNNPLLSWHDAIALGILPPEFPAQLRSVGQTESASAPSSESTSVNDRPISPPLGADTAAPSPAQGTESGPDAAHANPRPLWPDPTADSVVNDRRSPPSQQPTDDVTAARRAAPQTPPSSDVTDGCEISPIEDPTLAKVREAAKNDAEYASLCDTVLHGFPPQRSDLAVALRPYWGVRDHLAVDDGLLVCGSRLIIPRRLRQETLQRLHDSHQGIDRTLRAPANPSTGRGSTETSPPPYRHVRPATIGYPVSSGSPCYPTRHQNGYLSPYPRISSNTPAARTSYTPIACPAGPRSLTVPETPLPKLWFVTSAVCSRPPVCHACSAATVGHNTPPTTQKNSCSAGRHTPYLNTVLPPVQRSRRGSSETRQAAHPEGHHIRQPGTATPSPVASSKSATRPGRTADLQRKYYTATPLRSAVPIHHRAFAPEWQRVAEDCDKRADALRDAARDRYNVTAKPCPACTSAATSPYRTNPRACGTAAG